MSTVVFIADARIKILTFLEATRFFWPKFFQMRRERGLLIALILMFYMIRDALGLGFKYKNVLQLTFLPQHLDLRGVAIGPDAKESEVQNFYLFFAGLKKPITELFQSPEDQQACYDDLQKLLREALVQLRQAEQRAGGANKYFAGEHGIAIENLNQCIKSFSEQAEIVKACQMERLTIDLLEPLGECILTYRNDLPIAAEITASKRFSLWERTESEESLAEWVYEVSSADIPLQSEADTRGRQSLKLKLVHRWSIPSLLPTILEVVYENEKKEIIPLP